MSPTLERIPIILSENPIILNDEIKAATKINNATVTEIIKRGLEAKALEEVKNLKKTAELRQMERTMIALLQSDGLTKQEILAETEADKLISALARIRAYLRQHNLYTLQKGKRNKETRYYLDPIR